MSLIIEKLNGEKINLREQKVRVIDFIPDSPDITHTTAEVEDGGHVIIKTSEGIRTLTLTCRFVGRDIEDFYLGLHEMFNLFDGKTEFYIYNPFEGGIRWKVRTSGKFTPSRRLFSGDFTITFICPSKYAESVGTSLDLQNKGEWDADLWGYGSGINYDTRYNYTFNTNDFVVKNIGTEIVDPRISRLDITLKGVFTDQVKITNQTTGETFFYNGPLTATDTLTLTSIRALKNGVSVFKDTNKRVLTLAPGDNHFIVEGGTVNNIIYDFKFLYK